MQEIKCPNSIYHRISVRKYQDKPVEKEKIEAMLRAAMQAPSAGNQQPWAFYVVTNREKLEALSKVHRYAGMVGNAPAAIVSAYKTECWMKRVYPRIVLLIVSGLVCLLFLLSGCKKGTASAQNVPLDAETINTALEKAKLSGVFAESETYTNSQGHVHYVVQNPSYSSESIDDILFIADVSAFDCGGERLLFSVFYQKLDTSDIDWDAWKPQLDFAALLYDGFENPEDVYQAFCGKELPGPPDNNKTYKWEASLPEGYCIVNYMPYSYKTHDENGFEVIKHSATFRVNIYESFEVYQKIQSHTEDVSIALRNSD